MPRCTETAPREHPQRTAQQQRPPFRFVQRGGTATTLARITVSYCALAYHSSLDKKETDG
jgi:hypothetical protein